MQEKVKTTRAVVTGKSGNKSIKVAVDYKVKIPKYEKFIKRRAELGVHDEHNQASAGDVVEIAEARPYSKSKKWRLVRIIEKTTGQ